MARARKKTWSWFLQTKCRSQPWLCDSEFLLNELAQIRELTRYFSSGEFFSRPHSVCFSPAAGLRICGKQRCEYVALRLDAPGFCRDGERRHRRGHSRSDLPTVGA